MRENTRRNATSGFRPQSQYRPMFTLNRESRRVTFLTRTPTLQQRASNDDNNNNNNAAAPSAPVQPEGDKAQKESSVAPNGNEDIGSMDEIRQMSPNFASSATPVVAREAVPAGAAIVSERKSESGERPLLEKEPEAGKSTESTIPPPPRDTTPSPPPVSSPTHATPKRAPSPTPSASTSKQTTAVVRPSRSVRMRTPKRLPDPPVPPAYVDRDYGRPSSPAPRSSVSLPRTSSIGSSRTHESGMRSTSPTPLLPPVPPVPIIPPAEPSASSSSSSQPSRLSWSKSPLRNSVLPSDNPVILPRPKNAPAPPRTSESSRPVSPTSTLGHLPSLSSSTSQSGEPPKPPHNRFLGSLKRGKGKGKSSVETAGVNQRPQSDASVYSTND